MKVKLVHASIGRLQHRWRHILPSSDQRVLSSAAVLGLLALLACAALLTPVAHAASFTVTKTADTNDGTCDSDCSLREAIRAANAAAGADTISLPAGTFTLTLAGSDDTANLGDLDVTGPLTINGAGQGSTIIQAGTTNSNGIDKIFSFNPLGLGAGFAASMSNLTLRFGKNPDTFGGGNGFGGCFDFDSGTSGVGSFTMSNVTVTDCQTTQADGGGGAIFLTSGGTISISNVIIQNNTAHRPSTNFGIGGGLFFGCAGGSGATVTISGSTISSNHAQDSGAQGGGMFLFGRCSGTPTLNYQLHNVTISGNQAANDGGGIYSTAPLTIDNMGGPSVISNNSSGRSGGGIWLNHTSQTSTISKVTITGNSAADGGGGIRLDSSATGNVLNLSFSRIVNNTAGSGKGSGLSVNNGTANADNNWWGCSTGPSAAPCDTAKVDPASGGGPAGTGSVTFNPWLRVLTTASPSTIVTNQSTSLSASVNTNSNGQDVSANNDLLKGLAVTWSAVGGNISGAQTTIQPGGTATASYQATAALAGNKAAAVVDNDGTTNGSNVAVITVNKADTTTTITSDTPDPTVTGQPYTVSYSVLGSQGNSPTAPSGNVTVSDGTNSCTGTVAAGQCTLTSFTAGNKSLTATYSGDSNFNGSSSTPATPHTVNKADTTTAITSDNPDPSVVGQPVTVQYSVAVNSPGSGTPTGNVTVSDGTQSCTGTVAAGQCTIAFTSAGAKTLTATYAGDANYNGSTSASVSHQVNKANTATTITSDLPDPSAVGQVVTVQYSVVAVAPGAGTPTGNVTVSDGVDSCTGTVAAGQCTITLTTPGSRPLTATYAGDSNFNGSTSASAPHTVNKIATTTTITSDNPDPSVVGQAVTVQYSVAISGPGSGTPTGNVTVSDGTNSCTGTVAAGQCTLTFTSAGAKSLTATYTGDSNFNGSTSAAVPHQVDKADTTTTITSDNPDPSVVGQSVSVQYSVTANSPGGGTPTGNVTVSDGTQSCTGTVAAGQCTITFTSAGAKSLTATYAGDANYNGSTSASVPHQVNKADTTTTITSDNPDPSVVGQAVTVQFSVVAVAPGGGTPAGNVTVSDGVDSCTGTVATGTCNITLTTPGARTLTATYAGDANFNISTSVGEPHTVNLAGTTTTITSDSPDPSAVGQSVTVQYSVTSGSGTPTGNVTVTDGTVSCTGTVAAGQCTITFTSAGAKNLIATYAGDSNFGGSISAAEPHQVNAADTTTTITADTPDPSVVGQSVTIQFTVAAVAPGGGTPTGNVTVSDGAQSCTGTVAAGQCTITFTSAGNKSLTATYAGDANYNGSASAAAAHTVNPADTVTTITSDNPDPSAVGQAVTLQFTVVAVAPGAGTPSGNVTVSDGTISCTATVAVGQCSLTFTSAGAKSLTATYAGDSNFNTSTSAAEPHQVNGAATTTTIISDSPDPSVVGQVVTVQYTVTSGSGTPTGNVTVSDGTISCTGTVAAGQCSLTFTSAGAKSLTATYAGDSNFSGSTSAAEAHQVDKADTTTTITADNPDPSTQGQAVTVQYNVTVNAPGAGTPTGNVTVSDGVDSCTGTVTSGSCAIMLATSGNRTLTATYAGDVNFNTSTSATEPHSVNPSSVSIAPTSVNVAEGGATATYQVVLLTQPSANVTINISTDGQTTVNPTALTFTPANWNTPQTVTVTAVDDSVVEGTHTSTISHSATSADGNYNAISIPNVTATIADNDSGVPTFKVYLPMVMRDVPPFLPDLVVERINVTHTNIQVVIRNQGPAPVTSAFWVDVYINPNPAPTGVNQIWQDLASEGLVWGIPDAALPLAPGGTLTLNIGDSYYHPEASVFSGSLAAGTLIYAQVDSANSQTNYGGVLETHELTGGTYNNISSTTVPAAGVLLEAMPSFDRPRDEIHLPARRKGPRSSPR